MRPLTMLGLCVAVALCCSACSSATPPAAEVKVVEAVPFPNPDFTPDHSGDDIFSEKGYTTTIQDTGALFVMVDASLTAKPPTGARRNTQGTLTVTLNGKPCGWDSYGNEFKTSTAAMNVHCFDRGVGPYTINVKGWLWHCCEGGEVKWPGFNDRQTLVKVYAFRAEVPNKQGENQKAAGSGLQ